MHDSLTHKKKLNNQEGTLENPKLEKKDIRLVVAEDTEQIMSIASSEIGNYKFDKDGSLHQDYIQNVRVSNNNVVLNPQGQPIENFV